MSDPSRLLQQALQLHGSGNIAAAEGLYLRLLKTRPEDFDALRLLGLVRYQQGRPTEACALIGAALKQNPQSPPALLDYGLALSALQRHAEALAAYDRALAIKPDFSAVLNNRGNVLLSLNRPQEALASFDRALAIEPSDADALNNRGNALRSLERLPEALASFDKALAVEPDHRYAFDGMADAALSVCDFARVAALAPQLEERFRRRQSIINPFRLVVLGVPAALQIAGTRMFVASEIAAADPLWKGTIRHHQRLRIAYLSADFHRHATAVLMAQLFELHDRARFEILGVSFGPDDKSDMRARLVKAFDQFHDVSGQSDLEIAKLIHALEVDIAVDLKGHTRGARPGILAHRCAPVQAAYLGYPGTMGAPFIDYVIADPVVLPFDQQPFYQERIVHLPDCYQVTDATRTIPAATPSRREAHLPDDGFVFCCFNNSFKITPQVFDVWMRLLRAVDGSVLWLLRANDAAMVNLRRQARASGIDPARLIFAARLPYQDHLARHRVADLFVDTLPYNAHTTASDALWMGLPVLTCRGASFAGRVAASLLQAAGLPELITGSFAEYEGLALRLARDAPLLRSLGDRLERNRSTCALFDTDRFRHHIESAYTTMWEIAQRGESPRSFRVEVIPPVGSRLPEGPGLAHRLARPLAP
jgi:protein O-GlcNAc transferase